MNPWDVQPPNTRGFHGQGSPLAGGPFPGREQDSTPFQLEKGARLWRFTPSTVALPDTSVVSLSPDSQIIAVAHIFAEETNDVPIQIGGRGLRASSTFVWDQVSFTLDPGRSAWITTDDPDLADFRAIQPGATSIQLLYVTVWGYVFTR